MKIRLTSIVAAVGIIVYAGIASAPLHGPDTAEPKANAKTEKSGKRFSCIDLAQVQADGEIGWRIDLTIRANLLAIDVENQVLKPFRERQGWPVDKEPYVDYVGIGKIIDAAVSFARYSKNPQVIEFKDRLVKDLLATQLDDGYIGIFPPQDRIHKLWDLHEMVYIIHALVNNYRYCHDQPSLDAARRLADYLLKNRKSTAPIPHLTAKIDTERALIALSEVTADTRYRDYAIEVMDLRNWKDPAAGHAYTFMNNCLAQLDLYREKPDDSLLVQSRKVLDYLTKNDGLMIDGTCSHVEGFHNNQDTRGDLGESCATAYLIRLMHYLIQIEGESRCGDIMERAVFNALFAAQSPDGRKLRYFTCIDGPRVYWNKDTFCCPGNWRRIVAELPEMIYYRSADGGLMVNLYTASTAKVRIAEDISVQVRQKTDYPNSGKVVLAIEPSRSAEFPLYLRIPRWCKTAKISINDQPVGDSIKSGDWYSIKRLWKQGDVVTLDMPMETRLVRGRKMQAGKLAVMRGPLVFCLAPERQQANPLLDKKTQDGNSAENKKNWVEALNRLKFDWNSLAAPQADQTIRPGGLSMQIRAWGPNSDREKPADLTLLLTEFVDPAGEMTYFPTDDPNLAVEDELYDTPPAGEYVNKKGALLNNEFCFWSAMTAEGGFKPQTGRRFLYPRFGSEGAVSLHARSHHFHLLVVQIARDNASSLPTTPIEQREIFRLVKNPHPTVPPVENVIDHSSFDRSSSSWHASI
jgi:DUF1680 family protein